MKPATTRAWAVVHTWTSLVSTVFMLLLCLTGLPLIFHHEIDGWLGVAAPAPLTAGAPASVDTLAARALADHPGRVIQYIGWDEHEPGLAFVILNATAGSHPNDSITVNYDAARAEKLGPASSALMQVVLRLHVDLFAGLPGKLFLGAMGTLLVAAIVSGVVLYWPFTRRLAFGTIRPRRRIAWLDVHNLMGIVTATWLAVVGLTGVINTLSEPLIGRWKATELDAMTQAHRGEPAVAANTSLDRVLATAREAAPGMEAAFIAFPGSGFSTARHYGVFLKGSTPLTSKLLQPVLLDAGTGAVADTRTLPWYLTAILVSQPLHFGDYGGMPLKLIWAALDIVAIVVLGSGLYLWWTRRRSAGAAAFALAEAR
ncbi:PepSY-associated TM helix domain-containing protein [Methylobacterium sp. Leaf108]|uniref:PepSY-associated TM helix domain-containing protein n=1 Tax=Methylobacterium sp. Leaf108 TaxID=1736256 RepID=UPI0007011369|nr:PepSY-associated TM helix domain-containing protein [Methylobacterium sp. Leaf108]KQP61389.1 peptidase [Methylobacterium sp. Leaf108]